MKITEGFVTLAGILGAGTAGTTLAAALCYLVYLWMAEYMKLALLAGPLLR